MSKERFARYAVVAQRFGARTVLFQEAAARRLGFNATQLECFQLVRHLGPLTAVALARETGLTPASLSVIIDKLVDIGFLSREQDQADRRRWILRAEPDAIARVDSIYDAHASRTAAFLDAYTDEEFEVSLRFMDRLAEELKLTAVEFNQAD